MKQKKDNEHQDGPFSILDQGESNQSQILANTNIYEQLHLSPPTEIIPSAENEAITNISWQPQMDFHSSQELEDDPTYAVVSNKQQRKINHDPVTLSLNQDIIIVTNEKASADEDSKPKQGEDTLKEMYAVVKLKGEKEESASPIPPHVVDESYTQAVLQDAKSNVTTDNKEASNRVEELYTTVKKKPKEDESEEIAPPIPPHTVEELYTAVQKKPNSSVGDEEEMPPIPPHTIEELYTAVMKKPENSADEKEAPPIPPYMVDKLSSAVD